MTEQTQPTDAALEALAKDLRERAARCDAPGNELYVLGLREAAEAVINAKWGAPAGAGGDRMADGTRRMIEGMSVSIDVSTGDHDAGRRYFGTVTEVMDCNGDKHGVTLLVQDAEPNFTPQPTQAQAGAVPLTAGWCTHCGEGVTNFCRSKCGDRVCPIGLPRIKGADHA